MGEAAVSDDEDLIVFPFRHQRGKPSQALPHVEALNGGDSVEEACHRGQASPFFLVSASFDDASVT